MIVVRPSMKKYIDIDDDINVSHCTIKRYSSSEMSCYSDAILQKLFSEKLLFVFKEKRCRFIDRCNINIKDERFSVRY